MPTITIPKEKYDQLERQSALYDRLLKRAEALFPIERYSTFRLNAFLKEDRVNTTTKKVMRKVLKRNAQ